MVIGLLKNTDRKEAKKGLPFNLQKRAKEKDPTNIQMNFRKKKEKSLKRLLESLFSNFPSNRQGRAPST